MQLIAPIIDANIMLGQWPTRRVPCDQVGVLQAKLRAHNVTQAWASHYDALFHSNLTEVNNRLANACATSNANSRRPTVAGKATIELVAFGSVNPLHPNWQSELDRCHNTHRMPGIRLYPNYHNYKLDHPAFTALLTAAADRNLIVQLTVQMEDARMMHPLMRVPPVDLAPLEKLLPKTPSLRLVLLNALTTPARTDQLARLMQVGNAYTDIATLETLAGLEAVIKTLPHDRILFGSHAPSFYFESALLKLQESNLPAGHIRAIAHENAQRLFR